MQDYFYRLADFLQQQVSGQAAQERAQERAQECTQERFKCSFEAENTDFVRFNHGLIRQPGHVRQMFLTLDWIDGERHAASTIALAGHWEADQNELLNMVAALREQLPDLPPDPHFMMATDVHSSSHNVPSRLLNSDLMVDQILHAAKGYDFVGFLATGAMARGFANSCGQRNWHEIASFNLDWSLYQNADKAVKTSYAGLEWSQNAFRAKFDAAVEQLAVLQRDAVSIPPGAYRAYFTPAAMYELIGMLNWDGVSEKSLRTKQSSLRRMRDEQLCLNPAFSLMENTAQGIAPGFQEDGFIKPDQVRLIEHGRLVDSMISPRTAREYGIANNGAAAGEVMSSMEVAAGNLALDQILSELGTGVYVSNLWYLNFSDRAHCRLTGMTRFATFWVENGEIKAPLNVMRFDDSLFKLMGENLLGLTQEQEMLIDSDSYSSRGVGSARLPGALVKDLKFVL